MKPIAVESAERLYYRVDFNTAAQSPSVFKRVEVSGDTLYVAEIVGRRAIYASLNKKDTAQINAFIRLEEGMTITRPYNFVVLRSEDAPVTSPSNLGETRATLYASRGRLVEVTARKMGLKSGFLTGNGTATTAMASVFASAVTGGKHPTIGKLGGLVVIQNTDLGNTLLIRYGDSTVAAVGSVCFPLLPGASISLPLGGLIHQAGESVLVGTASGSCAFSWLASEGAYDMGDVGQPNANGVQLA